MRNTSVAYGSVARFLHWGNALLIILLWATSDMGNPFLYQSHIGLGMALLGLSTVQVLWYLADRSPDMLAGLSTWRQRAITWNHRLILLAVLMTVFSGVGILFANGIGLGAALMPFSIDPNQVRETLMTGLHESSSAIIGALLAMHVAGVLYYQLFKGDTLSRMGVNIFAPKKRLRAVYSG
ncbi:MAG: cytochrome b/b6 domain-containing protein [Chloroflexota bacterium]